jgi:hypothetical protein
MNNINNDVVDLSNPDMLWELWNMAGTGHRGCCLWNLHVWLWKPKFILVNVVEAE